MVEEKEEEEEEEEEGGCDLYVRRGRHVRELSYKMAQAIAQQRSLSMDF